MKRVTVYNLLLTAVLLSACAPLKDAARAVRGWLNPSPTPRPTHLPALNLDNISPREASLNARTPPAPAGGTFKFLVIGHLYGTPNSDDTSPDAALLNQLSALNNLQLSFMVSLGDMVRRSTAEDFNALEQLFLRRVSFPVFNTVGNHDVENRALYQSYYGPTYYSFSYGPARLIFLDTERETCAVDAAQRQVLARALQSALQDASVQHIFIFMHKTLFFRNDALAALKLDPFGPNDWVCYGNAAFPALLAELIAPAAALKPIILFAGDVGAWGNLTPWYEQRANPPLTQVMTGLGDHPNDAGILVTVNQDGVRMELYPLAGTSLPALQTFTPQYWESMAQAATTPKP